MRMLAGLTICGLLLTSVASGDERSHRASAERFLKLANAEGMTAPIYAQVDQLLDLRFAQMGGSMQQKSVLHEHRQQAHEILDRQLSWPALRDALIDLYLPVFTEQEFEQLAVFYRSPAGSKLLQHLPELTQGSLAITRERVEQDIAPQLDQLVEHMAQEVERHQQGER